MSYCSKCGAQIPDGSAFCPKCGEPVVKTTYKNNIELNNNSNHSSYGGEISYQDYTMKWFKYLIYAGMFIYAIILLLFPISYFFGDYRFFYSQGLEVTYDKDPSLRILDILFVLFCIVMAVRGILIRQDLAHYKKKAGDSFVRDTSIFIIVYLIYDIATIIIQQDISVGYVIVAAVYFALTAVYIYCNVRYFKKREGLFQN